MKNADKYRPTRFVYRGDRLIASRDVEEVAVASRLNVDLTAAAYESALKTHATGRLLDLGCGTVPLYIAYKRFVEQVTCVDWAGTARSKDFLDVEANLAEPLPFDDAAFDTLIVSGVLEHTSEPEPLWKEMHRVLAPGGKILMNVPFYYCLHEQPYNFFCYTEYALRWFAKIVGLAVVELRAIGGAKQVIADILAKKFAQWPAVGSSLASAVQWIGGRGVSNTSSPSSLTSERFPLGYFLVAQKPQASSTATVGIGSRVARSEKAKHVIVYRNDLLPMSETFVQQQFIALNEWRGTLAGMRRASPSINLTELNIRVFPLNALPLIGGVCTRVMKFLSLKPILVERWLAGLQAHLVHVHFGVDAVALWPAARRLQIPMLVTLHGYDITIASAWWQAGLGGKRHRNYHQTLIEMSRDRRVHFVAVSRSIRDRAIELGIAEDKVSVLHIGIDIEAFIPGPVPLSMRPSRILFVGRLVEKKGCDVLIRAVHRLMPMVPDVEVVIVGDGPLRGELARLAAKLSVPVYFAGSMARDEVKQQLDRARVFCLPSIVAENGDAEGFGLVLLEAQACGVPVVTSAQGGASEGVIEGVTGLSFPEKDVATLAKHLIRLLTDDQCIARMSDAAPRFVAEHFDVRTCTRALEGLYDELVRVSG